MANRLWNNYYYYYSDARMHNGAVKALRQALLRLHYIIKADMQAKDTCGRTQHVCHSAIQEWDLSLNEQLTDHARYTTRSDMQCNARGSDSIGTMKALQKFSRADQCLLRRIMTGAVTPAAALHAQNEGNLAR